MKERKSEEEKGKFWTNHHWWEKVLEKEENPEHEPDERLPWTTKWEEEGPKYSSQFSFFLGKWRKKMVEKLRKWKGMWENVLVFGEREKRGVIYKEEKQKESVFTRGVYQKLQRNKSTLSFKTRQLVSTRLATRIIIKIFTIKTLLQTKSFTPLNKKINVYINSKKLSTYLYHTLI